MSDFASTDFEAALDAVEELTSNRQTTRKRAREVAEKYFDLESVGVERYAQLYEEVLAGS